MRDVQPDSTRDLQEFPANVAAALQGPVRCEQYAVDDGRNGENTSNDGTGPEH